MGLGGGGSDGWVTRGPYPDEDREEGLLGDLTLMRTVKRGY